MKVEKRLEGMVLSKCMAARGHTHDRGWRKPSKAKQLIKLKSRMQLTGKLEKKSQSRVRASILNRQNSFLLQRLMGKTSR